eukprot:TRINITY_DN8934_c1_g1_i1.p1 TRINITY_DN8934_c1_g1~~TRINITY_DN8934_c1_g1_i1.p1  ORF type:complete len:412 (+),score=79.99 TRINITY_DN8934_c1_g1_i1:123-1358(+)
MGILGCCCCCCFRCGKRQPFKVEYQDLNSLPGCNCCCLRNCCSDKRRHNCLASVMAPKPSQAKNPADVDEKYKNSEVTEVVPEKVWLAEVHSMLDKNAVSDMKNGMGLDLTKAGMHCPPKMQEMVEKDVQQLKEFCKCKNDRDRVAKGGVVGFSMMVAKLKNGGLLVYNPGHMHDKVKLWLKSLGKVEFIVTGSAFHTLYIKNCADAFPDAKIIASTPAAAKLAKAKCRPIEYRYDVPDEYSEMAKKLPPQGITSHYVKGDVLSRALLVVAHGVLFETDLLYGNADKDSMSWLPKEQFLTDPRAWFGRLWWIMGIHKGSAPGGALPAYRVAGMDPSSTVNHSRIMWEPAQPSCLKEMASSLRSSLELDFDHALCAHQIGSHIMSKEEFCQHMEANWGWMDGSLLPDKNNKV